MNKDKKTAFCPKCGQLLVKRFLNDTMYYYCSNCVRGYPYQYIKDLEGGIEG